MSILHTIRAERANTNLLAGDRNTDSWQARQGRLRVSLIFTRLQMASHVGVWAPGTLVHFGSVDFIITTKGGPEQVHISVRPERPLDTLFKALERFQLHGAGDHPLDYRWLPDFDCSWLLDFDCGRMERQLDAFLDPS